ncbi:protein of unknown function [Streptomyces sp. KY70]|nr:protein of unknown function [Streptomyces sp. KY70]
MGAPRRRAGRGRDPAQLDGRGRHEGRVRHRDDRGGAQARHRPRHRLRRRGPPRGLRPGHRGGRGRGARRVGVPLRRPADLPGEGRAAGSGTAGPLTPSIPFGGIAGPRRPVIPPMRVHGTHRESGDRRRTTTAATRRTPTAPGRRAHGPPRGVVPPATTERIPRAAAPPRTPTGPTPEPLPYAHRPAGLRRGHHRSPADRPGTRRPGRRRQPLRARPGPHQRLHRGEPRLVRHLPDLRLLARRERIRRRHHLLPDLHRRRHVRRGRHLARLHRLPVLHRLARPAPGLAGLRGLHHRHQHHPRPARQPGPPAPVRAGLPDPAQLGTDPGRRLPARRDGPLDGRRRLAGSGQEPYVVEGGDPADRLEHRQDLARTAHAHAGGGGGRRHGRAGRHPLRAVLRVAARLAGQGLSGAAGCLALHAQLVRHHDRQVQPFVAEALHRQRHPLRAVPLPDPTAEPHHRGVPGHLPALLVGTSRSRRGPARNRSSGGSGPVPAHSAGAVRLGARTAPAGPPDAHLPPSLARS